VAPFDGVISEIIKPAGDIVKSAELIARFKEEALSEKHTSKTSDLKIDSLSSKLKESSIKSNGPAAEKLLKEHQIDPEDINGSGKDGRVTKADIVKYLEVSVETKVETDTLPKSQDEIITHASTERQEERVPMSRLRATIAKRLLDVRQGTAMLTTFNEVDMQPIKDLRAEYGKEFEDEHGVKLGFMGFFVLATVQALKKFPVVNASIDGSDIVYHGYQDIGVAVSTEKGLVVPVIRDADILDIADVEKSILDYSVKAKNGKLTIDDMQGGTFTISNGGVFGSLLSTPILNAPQTGILGMHTIKDRPVAIDGEVVIRPMMYLAMSYDHRLLDGKEAVAFLIAIKDQLESPEKLLLNI
jgi:2-oxoglutarate dehydrogenase E2 component (dihydrolipoamide succinyltransferase)